MSKADRFLVLVIPFNSRMDGLQLLSFLCGALRRAVSALTPTTLQALLTDEDSIDIRATNELPGPYFIGFEDDPFPPDGVDHPE